MHTKNLLSSMMIVPPALMEAASKDAEIIGYLEGVIRTTMNATTDDRTRRELRVKLDALKTGQALSSTQTLANR